MHQHISRLIALSYICMSAAAIVGQERKLTRNQLPTAVIATIDKETKDATIKSYSTEKENGKTVFEAETVVNGHTRDIQIATDGTLLEVEEEVPLASLAEPVSKALTSAARGATIKKVESLTKGGRLVSYEASTEKNGRKGEIQVGPNGEKLRHEE